MKNFIFYDYVYSKTEIKNLQKLCETATWERMGDLVEDAEQYENGSDVDDEDGNRYIATPEKYLDPDKLIQIYLDSLPEYAASCLNDGFVLSKGYTPDVKLSKYGKNDHYGWHCDCWEFHEATKYWKRQISSVTYLNDDYSGGETEFECGLTIKPEAGKTVIFPSTWAFPHRGKVVTEGVKYIYVKHIWV